MKIITISREFGSGGRELGKRLADVLGFDYYDKEIISAIAKNKNVSESFVQETLDNHGWQNIPLTFNSSFVGINTFKSSQTEILIEQKNVIEEIAKTGKDCIIVGRNADVLLEEYHPFNIFVCASMDRKVARCTKKARPGEDTSYKGMMKMIKRIDKARAKVREIITDSKFGISSSYDLTVNTSDWNLKELAVALADFINKFYVNEDSRGRGK